MATYTNQRVSVFDAAPVADRRRRVERDTTELLLARAECLPAGDQALLRSLYADGRTIPEVALLAGADPRSPPRSSGGGRTARRRATGPSSAPSPRAGAPTRRWPPPGAPPRAPPAGAPA